MMGGGGSEICLLTALAVAGCSVLFLALLRQNKLPTAAVQHQDQELTNPQPPKPATSSGNKKKVRFSEEVEEPAGNSREYRSRRRSSIIGKKDGEAERLKTGLGGRGRGREGELGAGLPANRRVLYNGILQYRSQMANLLLYTLL